MQRIDGPTRSANLPAPSPVGTGNSAPGYFQNGDPAVGVPATTLDVDWANGIQEEIAGVIEHAGIALDKGNRTQLLGALLGMFVPKGGNSDIIIGDGELSLPLGGGVILKAGSITGSFTEGAVAHNFTTPFPNGCFMVVPVAINASAGSTRDIWAQRVSKSAGSFTVMLQLGGGGNTTNSIDGIDWIALGN